MRSMITNNIGVILIVFVGLAYSDIIIFPPIQRSVYLVSFLEEKNEEKRYAVFPLNNDLNVIDTLNANDNLFDYLDSVGLIVTSGDSIVGLEVNLDYMCNNEEWFYHVVGSHSVSFDLFQELACSKSRYSLILGKSLYTVVVKRVPIYIQDRNVYKRIDSLVRDRVLPDLDSLH